MSFLDNLENNLKTLESAEGGKEAAERQTRAREQERARTLAVAPWAEELKKSAFTTDLFRQAALAGHSRRMKIQMAWLGATLRLEARERRLELRPTASGIVAVCLENQKEIRSEPLDLSGSAEDLVRNWLA
jgi:hypothetical protein